MTPDSDHSLFAGIKPLELAAYVESECERFGVSQRQFSEAVGIGRRSIQRILGGEAQKVDAFLLYNVAQFFGISPDELIRRAVMADEAKRTQANVAARYGFIARNFDLQRLKRIGFIESTADWEGIESRIVEFFGYGSVFEYGDELPRTAFSRTVHNPSADMRRFWMSSVHHQFKQLTAGAPPFNRGGLEALLPKTRAYTTDVERGFTAFVRALYRLGVLVLVESYVTTTAVYGATLEVDGRPCVVLTNRDKRYDRLWRTLAHELCHVLFDLDLIRREGYHISSQEPDLLSPYIEERADAFAADLFVPPAVRAEVAPVISVPLAVEVHARKLPVDPSLVYGLHLDVTLAGAPSDVRSAEYAKYRGDRIRPSTPALHAFPNLDTPSWQKTSLAETVPLIRSAIAPLTPS